MGSCTGAVVPGSVIVMRQGLRGAVGKAGAACEKEDEEEEEGEACGTMEIRAVPHMVSSSTSACWSRSILLCQREKNNWQRLVVFFVLTRQTGRVEGFLIVERNARGFNQNQNETYYQYGPSQATYSVVFGQAALVVYCSGLKIAFLPCWGTADSLKFYANKES